MPDSLIPCRDCGKDLPLDAFLSRDRVSKRAGSAEWYPDECKGCRRRRLSRLSAKRCYARDPENTWQKRNPEKTRAQRRRYHERHPGRSKEWAERNPEKAKAIQSRSSRRYRERHPEKANAWAKRNPEKVREAVRRWDKKHPDKRAASHRRHWLKKRYGLSESEFAEMVATQAGGCAICGSTEKLGVDHNHQSGAIRGILCTSCNSALGFLVDQPDLFEIALAYLERGEST